MPRNDRRLTPTEKDDSTLLNDHKFWLESLGQMRMAEPVMFQNVAPGEGAMLLLTAGLDDPDTRAFAFERMAGGLLKLSAQAKSIAANARAVAEPMVEETEEEMRMVTTQGPPLVRQRASIPPGKAKNEPMARAASGELVPAGKL